MWWSFEGKDEPNENQTWVCWLTSHQSSALPLGQTSSHELLNFSKVSHFVIGFLTRTTCQPYRFFSGQRTLAKAVRKATKSKVEVLKSHLNVKVKLEAEPLKTELGTWYRLPLGRSIHGLCSVFKQLCALYFQFSNNGVLCNFVAGKAFDITYVRIRFMSPRPESFAIYKRSGEGNPWIPYQFYSASCESTYSLPRRGIITKANEAVAICTDEFSDISPLTGGSVAFSTLEGRPSAFEFSESAELQVGDKLLCRWLGDKCMLNFDGDEKNYVHHAKGHFSA